MVALDESIIWAQRHKPEPRRTTVTGDWEATHTDSTLTNGKRPYWPASAPGLRTNTDGCCGHCNSSSRAHAVAASRMPHRRHAKNFARKLLSLPLNPTTPLSNAPADCPVRGKHCSCRVSVVTHGFNSRGVARSLALWKVNFPSEPE
ncbi:hypothetical protein TcCL_ESM10569 [Trypanosoma cruzi]|nr:hypothetical protein TcCL_ESM10569 [Trypanosoma cruzi]